MQEFQPAIVGGHPLGHGVVWPVQTNRGLNHDGNLTTQNWLFSHLMAKGLVSHPNHPLRVAHPKPMAATAFFF